MLLMFCQCHSISRGLISPLYGILPNQSISLLVLDACHLTFSFTCFILLLQLQLGDIVISVDTAQRQAEERGHTLLDEIRILVVACFFSLSLFFFEEGWLVFLIASISTFWYCSAPSLFIS